MNLHFIKTYPILQNPVNFIELLSNYIDQLYLDARIKQFVLNEDFINENPSIYKYYPYLFASIHPEFQQFDLLSIASFLYYKSVIYLDQIFDHGNVTVQDIVMIGVFPG